MFFIIYLFFGFLSPMVLIGEREIGWWSVEDGKGKHVIREANLGSLFGLYSIIDTNWKLCRQIIIFFQNG